LPFNIATEKPVLLFGPSAVPLTKSVDYVNSQTQKTASGVVHDSRTSSEEIAKEGVQRKERKAQD